jgi:hypothetical protein
MSDDVVGKDKELPEKEEALEAEGADIYTTAIEKIVGSTTKEKSALEELRKKRVHFVLGELCEFLGVNKKSLHRIAKKRKMRLRQDRYYAINVAQARRILQDHYYHQGALALRRASSPSKKKPQDNSQSET